MKAAPQLRLPITVAANTALVSIDTARAVLGVDAETVQGLCQSGALLHTFDLHARGDGELANLRIWAECVSARQRMDAQPALPEAEVLDLIVGFSRSEQIAAGHLAQRFCLHRATVLRWHQAGELAGTITGGVLRFARPAVLQFLRSRRFS